MLLKPIDRSAPGKLRCRLIVACLVGVVVKAVLGAWIHVEFIGLAEPVQFRAVEDRFAGIIHIEHDIGIIHKKGCI